MENTQTIRVKVKCECDTRARCELCGKLMPEGEQMFKYHGYSANCDQYEK